MKFLILGGCVVVMAMLAVAEARGGGGKSENGGKNDRGKDDRGKDDRGKGDRGKDDRGKDDRGKGDHHANNNKCGNCTKQPTDVIICGIDKMNYTRTFSSECEMKVENCEHVGNEYTVQSKGACAAESYRCRDDHHGHNDDNNKCGNCTRQATDVIICGVDKKNHTRTFCSECEMKVESCEHVGNEYTLQSTGACAVDNSHGNHGNGGHRHRRSVDNDRNDRGKGDHHATDNKCGNCTKQATDVIICGVDKKNHTRTFSSECEMKVESCKHVGNEYTLQSKGACAVNNSHDSHGNGGHRHRRSGDEDHNAGGKGNGPVTKVGNPAILGKRRRAVRQVNNS